MFVVTQIAGDTVYNMLRLAEVECDSDERPLNPHKVRSTEVRFRFFFLAFIVIVFAYNEISSAAPVGATRDNISQHEYND